MMKLYLRNVIQTYIQSTLNFNQDFFIHLLPGLIIILGALSKYILKVVKPFYGISKVGNYWFAIYYNYHINSFALSKLIYNPCLLHRYKPFDIVELQTDDTLMLANKTFAAIEKKTIKIIKFMTKKQACLLFQISIKFYGT